MKNYFVVTSSKNRRFLIVFKIGIMTLPAKPNCLGFFFLKIGWSNIFGKVFGHLQWFLLGMFELCCWAFNNAKIRYLWFWFGFDNCNFSRNDFFRWYWDSFSLDYLIFFRRWVILNHRFKIWNFRNNEWDRFWAFKLVHLFILMSRFWLVVWNWRIRRQRQCGRTR